MTSAENKRVLTDEVIPTAAGQAGRAALHLVKDETLADPNDPMAYVDALSNPVLKATLQCIRNVGQILPPLEFEL